MTQIVSNKKEDYKETEYRGTVHVVCRVPLEEQSTMYVLHNYLHKIDADWPFIVDESDTLDPSGRPIANINAPTICAHCGGLEYLNPQLGPKDIRAVFEQFGIKPLEFFMKEEGDCKYNMNKEKDYGYAVRATV